MTPKIMKALVLISILTLSMIPLVSIAQTGDGYLMIRTYESGHKNYNKIIVTSRGKIIEEIPINPVLGQAQIEINETIDKYSRSGYKLNLMTSGVGIHGSYNVLITTYLFSINESQE